MAEPTTPGEVTEMDMDDLMAAYRLRLRLLTGLRGPERPAVALSVLAFGAALVHSVRAQLWPVAAGALDAGAGHEQVTAAMDLGPGGLAEGLLNWADEQLQTGRLTPGQHSEILVLAGFPFPPRADS